jgi:hypothetical protein
MVHGLNAKKGITVTHRGEKEIEMTAANKKNGMIEDLQITIDTVT